MKRKENQKIGTHCDVNLIIKNVTKSKKENQCLVNTIELLAITFEIDDWAIVQRGIRSVGPGRIVNVCLGLFELLGWVLKFVPDATRSGFQFIRRRHGQCFLTGPVINPKNWDLVIKQNDTSNIIADHYQERMNRVQYLVACSSRYEESPRPSTCVLLQKPAHKQ